MFGKCRLIRNIIFTALPLMLIVCCPVSAGSEQADAYAGYLARLEATTAESDILKNGFLPLDERIFIEKLENLGSVNVIPALDEKYGRLILFFADNDGRIVYKTDRLESNYRNRGEMHQPNIGLDSISFQDLNNDSLTDIVIICTCRNESGKTFKVGEVLFQSSNGFYRDWRLSDEINRFSMNQSVGVITAFARDGLSTGFLYTANTFDKLMQNGFIVIEDQSFTVDFERFGRTDVKSGIYSIAGYNILMIYLVNPDGRIMWNFQFMLDDFNFKTMDGIAFRDIDGDGVKDVIVMVNYAAFGEQESELKTLKYDYFIFYQRSGYFVEDVEFKASYECSRWDVLDTITQKARSFWGWEAGQ